MNPHDPGAFFSSDSEGFDAFVIKKVVPVRVSIRRSQRWNRTIGSILPAAGALQVTYREPC